PRHARRRPLWLARPVGRCGKTGRCAPPLAGRSAGGLATCDRGPIGAGEPLHGGEAGRSLARGPTSGRRVTRTPRSGEPLRVCMVLPPLVRAGMEIVASRLAMGLAGRGHRVSVACIEESGPLAAVLEAAGVGVHVVPAPGLASNLRAPGLIAF